MSVMITFLFYRSLPFIIFTFPIFFLYFKQWKKDCLKTKEREFQLQFKDALQSIVTALDVGYSLENALKEAEKELEILYGNKTRIIHEFQYMQRQLELNFTAEKVLQEFAERSPQEDVKNFVTVFCTLKRSGGDLVAVLKNTVQKIGTKIEIEKEIYSIIAAKRMEFKIMSVVPFGIIFYIGISFPQFLSVMYGNISGNLFMSFCLVLYITAYAIGENIMRIEV